MTIYKVRFKVGFIVPAYNILKLNYSAICQTY